MLLQFLQFCSGSVSFFIFFVIHFGIIWKIVLIFAFNLFYDITFFCPCPLPKKKKIKKPLHSTVISYLVSNIVLRILRVRLNVRELKWYPRNVEQRTLNYKYPWDESKWRGVGAQPIPSSYPLLHPDHKISGSRAVWRVLKPYRCQDRFLYLWPITILGWYECFTVLLSFPKD